MEAATNLPFQPDSDLLSCPIIVAVTGHRDLHLDDVKDLEQVFGETLCDLHLDAQGESERICLTALAAGADILAAQVGLRNGWKVIAPLPLPLDMYREDFNGDAWRGEKQKFEKLLADLKATPGCGYFFVGWAPGCNAHNTREHGHFRNLQYAFVGEYLTRHCEVLVAFWDGLEVPDIGGTGDVVAMQQTGIPTRLLELRRDGALLDAPESGRVIQIWTRRTRHQTPAFDESKRCQSEPLQAPSAPLDPAKQKVAQARIEKQREERRAFVESASATFAKDPYDQLPSQVAHGSRVLAAICDSFVRADALATARQESVTQLFHLILAAAAAFIFLVGVAGAFAPNHVTEASLLLSWGFLALAWGIARRKTTVELQNQYQDYRALAEAWRVCFFWRAVGIPTEIATAYLRYQRGELDWIRQALNTHDLKSRALNEKRQPTPEDFQSVYTHWVRDQSKYFRHPTNLSEGKVPGLRKTLTKCHNWSWFLLFAGLCAAAVATVADLLSRNAFTSGSLGDNAWLFARNFFSADRLASPFTPALLLLSRMDSWPLVTEENTQASPAGSADKQQRLRQLHKWILKRNARQRALFIGVSLLAVILASASALNTNAGDALKPWLKVIETACFFAPALFFLYADINAIPEHVESYERMANIFSRAQQMLEKMAGIQPGAMGNWSNWAHEETQLRAYRVLEELGREALHENGEWLLIHRDRPLDIEA